jgi:hypothetical protein
MARRDRFVPLSRTLIPRIVLQDRLCSVHAGAAFSLLRPRLCAVNVKLTMGLGIGASLLVSAHSSACPGLLQGPARLLHRRCQTVWSSRGEGWGCNPFSLRGKISTDQGGLSQSPPFFVACPALRYVTSRRAASGPTSFLRGYSAASRKSGFDSERALSCRGGPIRTGWKNTAAPIVHNSASAISLPMLDIPG